MDSTTTDEQSKIQTAKEEAVTQARSVAETAGEQTKQVASDVADEVKNQIGDQKAKLASSIREIGDELEQAAQGSTGTVAGIAGQAADTTRQVSSWIENHDARDVLGEIEDFARQRPSLSCSGLLRWASWWGGSPAVRSHRRATTRVRRLTFASPPNPWLARACNRI